MGVAEPDDFDVVVMDAEPLVSYFLDEEGSEIVERFLVAVENGSINGYVHDLTRTEALYICARVADEHTAERYVESLATNGFATDVSGAIWKEAGKIKVTHTIAIGDAYALATARTIAAAQESRDVLLLVGADDDFDPFVDTGEGDGPQIARFRDKAD